MFRFFYFTYAYQISGLSASLKVVDSLNVHSSYKLKIVYKTWQQKHSVKPVFFFNKIKFVGFHAAVLVKTFQFMHI